MSISLLTQRRDAAKQQWQAAQTAELLITVGVGTCGLAAGAQDSLTAIEQGLARRGLSAQIRPVGCVGMCSYEPMVELQAAGRPRLNYGNATAEHVPEILDHYLNGQPLHEAVVVGEVQPTVAGANGHALHSLRFVQPGAAEPIPFQSKQLRIVLSNCGLIDPESIDDYLALNGYAALERALSSMTPEQVIDEVTKSGLRGRGGGGFPPASSGAWPQDAALAQVRHLQRGRGRPRRVHGPLGAGGRPALGDRGHDHRRLCHRRAAGYIYCRAEYPLAIKRLRRRIEQARELGLLGEDILGSGFSFDIAVKEGAGAFVCGEETALMASIQGERGQPWPRPPYPAVAGLWGQAQQRQQRQELRLHPAHPAPGRGLVQEGWHRRQPRHGRLRPHRPGQAHRPDRGAHGHHPARDHLRCGGGVRPARIQGVQTGGPLGGCLPEALSTRRWTSTRCARPAR
jgi:NADH-quinone oxidoreductase subunit F